MKNKKGFKHKNSWGRYSKLKYEYACEFEEPVKEYKMNKKELDDINVFNVCEYEGKELNKLLDKFYKKDDIYYYKDKECTQKVVGLLRSKKKKYVKGGILIQEQPYAITEKTYVFRG